MEQLYGSRRHWQHFEELIDSVNNIGGLYHVFNFTSIIIPSLANPGSPGNSPLKGRESFPKCRTRGEPPFSSGRGSTGLQFLALRYLRSTYSSQQRAYEGLGRPLQGNQEPLVVKAGIEDTRMNLRWARPCMECDAFFPFSTPTLLVGRQEGHPACKK